MGGREGRRIGREGGGRGKYCERDEWGGKGLDYYSCALVLDKT